MKWDLKNITIEHGAWIKARLYPRRCSLSPDGKLLCYFALKGKWGTPWGTYFAISKLPWLTALCAWSVGDTWASGCWFYENDILGISGLPDAKPSHGDFHPAIRKVKRKSPSECNFGIEIEQDWIRTSSKLCKIVDDMIPRRKLKYPSERICLTKYEDTFGHHLLQVSDGTDFDIQSVEGRDVEYLMMSKDGVIHELPDALWADWNHHGFLLIATRTGQLQIRDPRQGPDAVIWKYDLSEMTPDPTPAPDWAQQW